MRDNVLVALACAERTQPTLTAILRTPARLVQANEILARIGFEGFADRATPELSQGQRKLLDIALAMVGRSDVLLLDEPTSGVSAQEKLPLLDLADGGDRRGERHAVLFVEHDMEIVERYAPG